MQEFKFKVVGDTKPAVAANEALDASINKIDDSSKKLESSLAKSGAALELSLQKQDAKIKAIGGSINILGGSVELVVGSLGLIGVDEKIVGQFQKAAVSAIAFADGAKRVFEGYKEITEAKKIFSTITKAETVAEAANTTATVANTTATVAGTAATNTANTATKALNATILTNPYVIAAAAVAALVAGIYLLVKAQNENNNELEREKKLREDLQSLFDAQYEFDLQAQANYVKELELKGKIAESEEARIDLKIKEKEAVNDASVKAIQKLKEEEAQQIKLLDAFKKVRDAENVSLELRQQFADKVTSTIIKLTEIQNKILLQDEKIIAAELAINEERQKIADEREAREEAARKKREENAAKAAKAAEDLAIRAVKQLKDEREAIEALADLYAQEYPDEGRTGFLKFNNDLDRTNFLLKEQLDVLFSLNTEYEDLSEELRNTQDELNAIGNGLGDTFLSEEIGETFFGGVLGESFFSEKQLEVFKKLRDAQKTGLQLQLEDLRETYLEDLALFTDNEELKTQLTEQYEKDRNALRLKAGAELASQILNTTSSLLGQLGNLQQEAINIELDKLERKYQRDLQLAGENQKLKESLTRGFEARELEIQKKALAQQKALRTAQVATTTAESVINAYNSTSQLPPPFNFIAGTALAAAYTVLGAKAIANINAVSLDNGSLGTGGFNNIPSGGGFSLPGGGGVSTSPSLGAILPGIGGGFVAPTTIGTVAEPIRAYVLSGDVSNGMQAGIALNNRRRLSGG
jgi:hypothetical protein